LAAFSGPRLLREQMRQRETHAEQANGSQPQEVAALDTVAKSGSACHGHGPHVTGLSRLTKIPRYFMQHSLALSVVENELQRV
jgi:hypothetical protein